MIKNPQILSKNQGFRNAHKFDKIQTVRGLLTPQTSFSCPYPTAPLPAHFHLCVSWVGSLSTAVPLCSSWPSCSCFPILKFHPEPSLLTVCGHLSRWLPCTVWFLPRALEQPPVARLRLENRVKAWQHLGQSPEGRAAGGKGWGRAYPALPSLQCILWLEAASPAGSSEPSHTWTCPQVRNEPGYFVPTNWAHRKEGRREEAPHPTRSAPWPPSCMSHSSVAVSGLSIFQSIPTKVGWHHCKIMRGVLLEKLFRQTFHDFFPMPLLCKNRMFTNWLAYRFSLFCS